MGKHGIRRRKKCVFRRLFWWTLACLWCAMAIYLSRQTGEQTTQLGLFVTDLTEKVLVRLGAIVPGSVLDALERFLPDTVVTLMRGGQVRTVYMHLVLRKAAHVGVYCGLGFLLMRAWAASMNARGHNQLWAVLPAGLLGGIVAVLDEMQKAYIPGRHCDWAEAQLNIAALAAGLLAGLLFGLVCQLICLPFRLGKNRRRRKRPEDAPQSGGGDEISNN